jgi:acylphosphatase
MEKSRAHIIIYGMVQGVGFRFETIMQARALGLNGWVMNMSNGAVEAIFEGDSKDVENVIEWCKKGPTGAIVDNVDVELQQYKGEFKNFDIRYSR